MAEPSPPEQLAAVAVADDEEEDDFQDALSDLGHLSLSEPQTTPDSLPDTDPGLPNVSAASISSSGATNLSDDNDLMTADSSDQPDENNVGNEHDNPQTSGAEEGACSNGDNFGEAGGGSDGETGVAENGGEDGAENLVDEEEERVKQMELLWTEEQKEEKKAEADDLKARGNRSFKAGDYDEAEELYTAALAVCPTCFSRERSIMYSNRSACKMRKEQDESAITDCTKALALDPTYIKCRLRRAELYEKTDKLDESLADFKLVYEQDPTVHMAICSAMRLEEKVNERNEKMKAEMMGQLKNLGNLILKPFGLSTENFELNQDPNSGGYSVNFKR